MDEQMEWSSFSMHLLMYTGPLSINEKVKFSIPSVLYKHSKFYFCYHGLFLDSIVFASTFQKLLHCMLIRHFALLSYFLTHVFQLAFSWNGKCSCMCGAGMGVSPHVLLHNLSVFSGNIMTHIQWNLSNFQYWSCNVNEVISLRLTLNTSKTFLACQSATCTCSSSTKTLYSLLLQWVSIRCVLYFCKGTLHAPYSQFT